VMAPTPDPFSSQRIGLSVVTSAELDELADISTPIDTITRQTHHPRPLARVPVDRGSRTLWEAQKPEGRT
jgi:hypothetical protein